MLNKFNRRASVSETMTWIIATLVIIIILLATYFIAHSLGKPELTLSDKGKDFVATKSITNFLSEEENFVIFQNSVKNKEYSEFDKTFKPLLEGLYTNVCGETCRYNGAWNLDMSYTGAVFIEHSLWIFSLGEEKKYETYFIFNIDNKNLKLNFWKSIGWINT